MKKFLARSKADQGAALPLVLIMIVILSITMAATAMLQQSTSQALVQNAGASEKRSAFISDALALAIQDLNYQDGKPVRLAVGDNAGVCEGFPKTYQDLPAKYVSTPSFPRPLSSGAVKVECGYRQQSGKLLALASLILTGTGNNSSCFTGSGGAQNCQVGRDGGLKVTLTGGGSDSCTSVKNRMTFSAGIMNVSGAWSGIGCNTIAFPKDVKLIQPDKAVLCPALANSFKDGNSAMTCSCPATTITEGSGGSQTNVNYAWQVADGANVSGYKTSACESDNAGVSGDDLDPLSPSSTLSGFMGGVISSLAEPTGWATSTLSTPCMVTLNSGIITGAILTSATKKITACGSGSSKVVQLKSGGVFRISNTALDLSGYKLLGGATSGTGANETCVAGAGAQLQFSGSASLTLDPKESNFLCAFDPNDRSIPTIVAPLSGTTATFSSTVDYFLKYPTGAPNSGSCGLTVTGYVFAPGSAITANLNGCASISFRDAAILKAMTINATAAVNYTGGAAAPPPFSGDRVVQFSFCEAEQTADLSGGTKWVCTKNLGTAQVVIRDFFARRWGVGTSVISWRTMW